MADLIQIAKSSDISTFIKAWCNEQTPKLNPATLTTEQHNSALSAYTAYKNYNSGRGSNSGTGGIIGNIVGNISDVIGTQEQKGYMPEELLKTQDTIGLIYDQNLGKLKDIKDIAEGVIEQGKNQILTFLQQETELIGKVNKEAGMTGLIAEDFRNELMEAGPELARLGIRFSELSDSAVTLVKNTGRFATINAETWKEAGVAASAFVGSLQDLVGMYSEFEKVGLGASDTNKTITRAGEKSIGLGLQAQKTSTELRTNIGKLNEYGFQKGVDGLSTMIRKATEFRIGLQEVFNIADKVMNPEGALELTANLQVLGGAIGDFNDPLKLMYMATNNVEGLQDALIGAAGSLATYNQEQGKFEITGVNLRRAKEMAVQMGISYQELAKGAIAAAERSSAASDLMARGLELDDDQKEFLTNIAQMKGGKMTIELNSDKIKEALGVSKDTREIALENLTNEQAKALFTYQEDLRKKTPEDIVRGQATNIENIMRDVNFLVGMLRVQAGKTGEELFKQYVIDGKDIRESVRKFANEQSPKIKTMSGEWTEGFKGIVNEVKETFKGKVEPQKGSEIPKENKKEETKPKSEQKETASTLNIKFGPIDPLLDKFSREMFRYPENFIPQFDERGYLSQSGRDMV